MMPNSDAMFAMFNFDLEYDGPDFTHTFKYGTQMFGFNYMQNIGRNLVLGFECMHVPQKKETVFSYGGRYNYLKHTFYAHYHALAESMTFAYLQRVNKNAQLITEFNVDTSDGSTKTTVGYRQMFQNTEVTATVNSKGKISSVMNLNNGLLNLKLCAVADYMKDDYKFGYGISVGQN